MLRILEPPASEEASGKPWISVCLPPLAGWCAAAFLLLITRPMIPHRLHFAGLLAWAILQVGLAFGAGWAMAYGLGTWLKEERGLERSRLALETAFTAAWLAPFWTLVAVRSFWAAPAGLILLIGMTRLLHVQYRASQMAESFGAKNGPSWPASMLRALAAALCVQAACVAVLLGYGMAGAALAAGTTAVIAWWFASTEISLERRPGFRNRPVVAVLLAFGITSIGLLHYLEIRRSPGVFGSGRHRAKGEPPPPVSSSDGGFPGVILWPEISARIRLVAPLPAMSRGPAGVHQVDPLSIPFDGQYWFFKQTDRRPPATSIERHGTPTELTVRATDHRPLSMEAVQNFGASIDLACCGSIQIEVSNKDKYPGTVSIELILISTVEPGRPSMSLGTVPVNSTPNWRRGLVDSAHPETLRFPIPASPSLRKFDEVRVVFHREGTIRADVGARVAIDRFLLVPRGS